MKDFNEKSSPLEKEIYQLHELLDIAYALNTTFSFEQIFEHIFLFFTANFSAKKFAIFARSNFESNACFLQRTMFGFDHPQNISYFIDEKSSFLKNLVSANSILTMDEALKLSAEDKSTWRTLKLLAPDLVLPMVFDKEVYGFIILNINDSTSYSLEESHYKRLLNEAANFSTIAIRNAVLYSMATIDQLTHMKQKFFFMKTAKELVTANKSLPITIIMMDIDYFKKFNDTYGHTEGDNLLHSVASVILKCVRSSDLVGRYGGEEFVAMLPKTTLENGKLLSERIREAIMATTLNIEGKRVGVTISGGVAGFNPELDNYDIGQTINRADQALYKAKDNGRNQIVVN